MTEYYDKELAKLEKQQRELRQRQDADDRDRYNTISERPESEHQYKKIVNAKLDIAPQTGDSLIDYVKKLQVYAKIASTKNWDTHVDNPYKTWHTHTRPHCFMCEDTQLIQIIIQSMEYIAKEHPDIKF